MAYEKSWAGGSSDHATTNDPDHTQQTPNRRRWTDVLVHRWPTALGVVVAALAAFDVDDGLEFAALTVLMALVYLGAAALDRRWFAWVVLLAGLAFLIPSTSEVGAELGVTRERVRQLQRKAERQLRGRSVTALAG